MPVSVKVEGTQAHIQLEELRESVADPRPLLDIAGEVMHESIERTFTEEGSPAGSWPRNKKYAADHELLIGHSDLKRSISYKTSANTLTIGSALSYSAVHQFGSADYRGAFTGPLTREQQKAHEMERVTVLAHSSSRDARRLYGFELRTNKNGVTRRQRVRLNKGARTVFQVREHKRHQNIPPRPYLVFRPEDAGAIAEGIQVYLAAKAGAQ